MLEWFLQPSGKTCDGDERRDTGSQGENSKGKNVVCIFRSRYITANKKIKIYKTALRSVVTFGLETCTLTTKNEQEPEVFERKVLRRIYGSVIDNGQWRKLYNHEIKQIYQSPPITEYLRAQRLLCMGHVQRMNESERIQKNVY